jgi:hypothetical protein
MSIFDDNQLLDDLIVGYCDIFSDEDPDMERYLMFGEDGTNESYFNEMEAS